MPLLIDQHTGSAIYIETIHDDSFFIFRIADAKLRFFDLAFFGFLKKTILGRTRHKKGPFMSTF